ncbi:MAG: flagellar motor switch protein FliG [Oscillospiraceae bacterium]
MASSSKASVNNSLKKVATIMIALGSESASEIYKFLRDDEIEEISCEISKIDRISAEEVKKIVDEFYDLCVAQKVVTEGGQKYAQDILEKAFGAQRSAMLIDRIAKSGQKRSFEFIRKVDNKNLLMMIQNEHPQTIAIILSYAKAEQASFIISELPQNVQVDVIKRISNLDRASPEVIAIVEEVLEKRLASINSVDLMEFGGVNYIAEIMNRVDRKTEKYILQELKEDSPELADEIKKLMFVFDDIIYLDNLEIQSFIREVDTKDLTIALKAANEEVANAIFANMSQRQQETIRTDMQYLHNLRMRDVEEAQQRIVAVIRQLEEAGEIIISKGGKDEIIA